MKRSFRNSLSATVVALCGTSTLFACSAPSAWAGTTDTIALSQSTLTAGYQGPLTLTITGTNTDFLQGGTVVYVLDGSTNLQDATNFQVQSPTQMSFSLAGGLPAGTYTVEVQTPPLGTSTQPKTETAQLTVNAGPSISSVSFAGVQNASYLGVGYPNTTVTVQTANETLSPQTQVLIKDSQGNVVSGALSGVQTDTSSGSVSFTLVGGSSGLSAGNYTLDIETNGQNLTSDFSVRSPQLAGSSVNVPLPSQGSQVVTLTATNAQFTAGGVKVKVGTHTYTNVTVTNNDQLQFTVGQGDFTSAGTQDVVVTDNAETITKAAYINFYTSGTVPTIAVSPASISATNTNVAMTLTTTGLQLGNSTLTVTNASGHIVTGITGSNTASTVSLVLPAGLSPGTYTISIVDNSQAPAVTATATFVVTSVAPTAISTNPSTLPTGVQGQAYPTVVISTNGSGTYTYSLLSGSLPSGLSLSPSGQITGTLGPAAKTQTITVQAMGDAGSITKAITIPVQAATQTSPQPNPTPSPTQNPTPSPTQSQPSPSQTATVDFTTPVVSEVVSTGAATFAKALGTGTVTVDVPAGAFKAPETVSVTTADVSALKVTPPKGTKLVSAVGVKFSGAAPGVPIKLTVENADIPDGALVYKILSDGTLKQVDATVTAGKAVISFSADPNFVIVSPPASTAQGQGSTDNGTGNGKSSGSPKITLQKYQRVLQFDGKTTLVPAIVRNGTTYMPIWYVMQLLDKLNIQSKWNGHDWKMTTDLSVDMTNVKPGHGTMSMYFNGHLVQHVTGFAAMDPYSGKDTTYMPVWFVMKVLHRVNIVSTWDGTTWGLTKK